MMSQNRFGSVCEKGQDRDWHSINFYCGEDKVFKYDFNKDDVDINPDMNFGKKTGSR
jgi:hypothetical protein